MTKQTQAAPEEKQNEELLLRRFKLMDDIIEKVRQENIKAGIDPAVMKVYIPWTDFVRRKIKYNGWLEACTNPLKPGKYNTIADLKKREKIPEDFISEHENETYPYRKLDSLYRIKDKAGKQWLMRLEGWYGLTSAGEEFRISVNDLDFYSKPNVRYEYIPKDPENPNGPSIRVGSILDNRGGDPLGDKVWTLPYSKEKVDELLSYGSINNEEPREATTLIISKEEGHGTPVTYDDFVSEDFDETLKRINKPAPTFDSFMKEFKDKIDKSSKDDKEPYA